METVKFTKLKEQSTVMKESLRALKTNIQFSGDDIKVIMITSSIPNEGKSTVTFGLARSLTESGKKVLVIDSDMRKSVLASRLRAKVNGDKEIYGLSHYLTGQKGLGQTLYVTEISRLFVMFAGPSVPNPTEVLEKKYFSELIDFARDSFDYILIDCAPLGAAIDAAVVAKHCDGAILVIAQDMASSRQVLAIKRQLEVSKVKILGAVLNKVKSKKNTYGGYYGGYYGSYYGNYGEN